jgi:hypothetical protein
MGARLEQGLPVVLESRHCLLLTKMQAVPQWQKHGGDFGFDVGCKAGQCIPRLSYLANTAEKLQTPTTSVSLSQPKAA